MKSSVNKILILVCSAFLLLSFTFPAVNEIKLMFVTYNGYGNNLYIDNITLGKVPQWDVSVAAVYNIKPDTTFTPDSNIMLIPLKAVLINTGRNSVSNIRTTLTIDEFSYSKTDTNITLNSGQGVLVSFDTIPIPTGTPFTIKLKIYSPFDSVKVNDSLVQKSLFLKGASRNILLEEFTSSVSPGAALMDPYLDLFVNDNFENVCAIRYHCGIPGPPYDSIYLSDSAYSDFRRLYYYTSAVPTTFFDGIYPASLPYSNDSLLYSLAYSRFREGSPLSLSVKDSLLPGDTIISTINVNILFPLKESGKYILRAAAVERSVHLSAPQISGGLSIFQDVFRKLISDTNGIEIPKAPGSYQYSFKYPIKIGWTDSLIYTTAFVQDDNYKQVLNSAKGRNYTGYGNADKIPISKSIFKPESIFPNSVINPKSNYFLPVVKAEDLLQADTLTTIIYEAFESSFPPPGWTSKNQDAFFSFEKFSPANGKTLGGFASMRIPFYSYSNIGAKDTVISSSVFGITAFDTLTFDYAYAPYLLTYADSLNVFISIDGGINYEPIFSAGGSALATAPSTTLPFEPRSAGEWRTFVYPLGNIIPQNGYFSKGDEAFELFQNYPNPFNPLSKIKYSIFKEGNYSIKLYDVTGRLISVLMNNVSLRKGNYELNIDATNLSNGVYFYVMSTREYLVTKKLVVLK